MSDSELSPFLARNRPYTPTPEQRAAMDRSKKFHDPLRVQNGALIGEGSTSQRLDELLPYGSRLIKA